MNAASIDIKDLLEAEYDLGLIFSDNLFIGREPEKPDSCVTIYDTSGVPPSLSLDSTKYYYESIQIRNRNTSYEDGYNEAFAIMEFLNAKHGETVNGSTYTIVQCSTPPTLLQWDDSNRVIFITNYSLQRKESA